MNHHNHHNHHHHHNDLSMGFNCDKSMHTHVPPQIGHCWDNPNTDADTLSQESTKSAANENHSSDDHSSHHSSDISMVSIHAVSSVISIASSTTNSIFTSTSGSSTNTNSNGDGNRRGKGIIDHDDSDHDIDISSNSVSNSSSDTSSSDSSESSSSTSTSTSTASTDSSSNSSHSRNTDGSDNSDCCNSCNCSNTRSGSAANKGHCDDDNDNDHDHDSHTEVQREGERENGNNHRVKSMINNSGNNDSETKENGESLFVKNNINDDDSNNANGDKNNELFDLNSRQDYLFEMLYNDLKMDEESYRNSSKYREFESEKDMLSCYRDECIGYMHRWYNKYKLSIYSFSLGVEMLHRLMGELHLTKTNAMLVALAILHIAAKYHENDDGHSKVCYVVFTPHILIFRLLFLVHVLSCCFQFCYCCCFVQARALLRGELHKNSRNRCYKEPLLKLEKQFLGCLNYSLTFPSIVSFADIFVSLFGEPVIISSNRMHFYDMDNEKDKNELLLPIREQVYAILENAMIKSYTAYYKPSIIAAICVKHVLTVYRTNNTDLIFDFRKQLQLLNQCLTNDQHTKHITQSKTGMQVANLCLYLST